MSNSNNKNKTEKFKIRIGDTTRTFIMKFPTPKIEAQANVYSSRVFSTLIKSNKKSEDGGLLLRDTLDRFLREQGLYTEEDVKEIVEVQKLISEHESVLKSGGSKQKGKEAAVALRGLRIYLIELLSKRSEYDKNTVEYHAEEARINYIMSECICDQDGFKIFQSADDYKYDETGLKEDLKPIISKLGALCSVFDENFIDNLPEHMFLKKYGFCNEDYDLVDKDGNLVDGEGRRIDEDGNYLDENGEVVKENQVFVLGDFTDEDEEQEEIKEKPKRTRRAKKTKLDTTE